MTAPPSLWRAATGGLALGLLFVGSGLADERSGAPGSPDRPVEADASSAARQLKAWVLETADNQGLPFLIIDKINAEVLAFNREGQLLGTSPVLLGLARGDISPAGVGDRPLSAITPGERITPTGRFLASLGENLGGKGILWIDYDAALSLHPVVTTRAADRRLQRLASTTAEDNRISYGCVNVPVDFYVEVVQPAFTGTTGIVYILPETRSLADVFPLDTGVAPLAPGGGGPP
ncbi:L,D-transpeptidase [Brevundimonas sp.]|uniref:L,D-transpeptidase n=1 Tax=Brevundimonas sp. TaxID=1871086 RepID=UPI00272FE62F|nr:L,D-transpeptidase [Brevundimonas sp.]MDP1912900.1 L,D-transpeptidase [Brevundimonas sp.]